MRTLAALALISATAAADSPLPDSPLPDADAKRLAAEKLAGDVALDASTQLYASEADARAHAGDTLARPAQLVAFTVVRDRGDVVELTTKPAKDCLEGFSEPFALDVFVARAQLVPRLDAGRVEAFPDRTAAAADRGAGVRILPRVAWDEPDLAVAKLAPDPAHLRYGIAGPFKPTALPRLAGEPLVCSGLSRMTAADYRQLQKSGFNQGYTPRCGLVDPKDAVFAPSPNAPLPQVAGEDRPWPNEAMTTSNDHVIADGTSFLADVGFRCGRVRYRAKDGLSVVAYGWGRSESTTVTVYAPSPGPVTWKASGQPAGTFLGGRRYHEQSIEKAGDRMCVALPQLSDRVCFPAARVKSVKAIKGDRDVE